MFTGIVQGQAEIISIEVKPGLHSLWLQFPEGACQGLATGASVAIDGTCLTVTDFEGDRARFDVMQETLARTKSQTYHQGQQVHFERAARIGDEIGGHLMSGHIHTRARLEAVEHSENNVTLTFAVPDRWIRYIFPKGFIAIDGASLTVGEVQGDTFTVHLIPETLRVTHFGELVPGDSANIEIDTQTQTIVDTLARLGYTPREGA